MVSTVEVPLTTAQPQPAPKVPVTSCDVLIQNGGQQVCAPQNGAVGMSSGMQIRQQQPVATQAMNMQMQQQQVRPINGHVTMPNTCNVPAAQSCMYMQQQQHAAAPQPSISLQHSPNHTKADAQQTILLKTLQGRIQREQQCEGHQYGGAINNTIPQPQQPNGFVNNGAAAAVNMNMNNNHLVGFQHPGHQITNMAAAANQPIRHVLPPEMMTQNHVYSAGRF